MQNNKADSINLNTYYNFLIKLSKKLNKFYWLNLHKKLNIKNKSKNEKYDPVTIFDKSFEKIIIKEIKEKFTEHSILGEEYGLIKKRKSYYKWIIDPIDGTKSFIAGNPTWSNIIGLDFKGTPLIGMANFPELKKFYINSIDGLAFVFNNNKKTILNVSKNKNFSKIKIAGSINCFLNYMKKENIRQVTELLQFNSFDSLTIGNFCEGRIDAVVGCGNKSCDIHPWIPIIKSSGGIITNWKGEETFHDGNVVISNNKQNHSKIIDKLNLIL